MLLLRDTSAKNVACFLLLLIGEISVCGFETEFTPFLFVRLGSREALSTSTMDDG
jgi:hypothetical protein